MNHYLPWSITLGSLIGMFVGIFWFDMGLSMLAGVSAGIILAAALAVLRPRKATG